MAKPNFQYEKRQKELEKKRKKDEKLKRKQLDKNPLPTDEQSEQPELPASPPPEGNTQPGT